MSTIDIEHITIESEVIYLPPVEKCYTLAICTKNANGRRRIDSMSFPTLEQAREEVNRQVHNNKNWTTLQIWQGYDLIELSSSLS